MVNCRGRLSRRTPFPETVAVDDPRIERMDIRRTMQQSYLTYAMSVIVSRALPDAATASSRAQRASWSP